METIPELVYKNNDEINDLLNCEEKLDDFIESLPDVASIINRCNQLSEENTILANQNIELKNDYEKTRDQTLIKVQELTTLQASFDNLVAQQHQLTDKLAPSNIQEQTMIAASQSEEESEKIAEEFLQKDIDINTFLSQYVGKRVESHLRKFKAERLGKQLRELQRSGF
ncbi:UNVERIFIED_CONTAM: hypothetical protein RMT77_014549 [Armadillidium vulgare]|nr:Vacuolar protein sorting-associated protein 37A [Armadillidium vulgare]